MLKEMQQKLKTRHHMLRVIQQLPLDMVHMLKVYSLLHAVYIHMLKVMLQAVSDMQVTLRVKLLLPQAVHRMRRVDIL